MSQKVMIDKDTVALCSQEVQYHIQNYVDVIRDREGLEESAETLFLLLGIKESVQALLHVISQQEALPLLTTEEEEVYAVSRDETSATDNGQMSIDDFIT